MKYLFLYLILWSSVMAVELPRQETYMDKSGWVWITIRDLSTLVVDDKGNWECQSTMHRITQEDYLRMICEQAPIGDKLRLISRLARHWARKDKPVWEALNITEEQYNDWLLTGILRTQEELDAAKPIPAEPQQAAIMSIKFYVSLSDKLYHTKDCPKCVNPVEVGIFELLNSGRMACECTKEVE